MDIAFVKDDELPFAKIFWVGNEYFGQAMKILAKNKGYKLTDTGIINLKTKISPKIKSEKDIFNLLGYKFVPYNLRNSNNIKEAIDLIRRGKIIFKDKVKNKLSKG
jgi:DNA polymerase/3'-5' exonuclease PolX